ncbi:MAG TPA: hypothetical protein DCY13_15520, partial [Verrucomicrobiales bacterium]|nr:hypothetical protein [Verrucomicrobiales bacterium]
MAGITTTGIGSGLDINQIVTDLVAAEIEPTRERLDREEAGALARISAFGLIKSAMAELETAVADMTEAESFVAASVSSSDEDVLTVAASGTAARGSFSVDVQRLAESHRLVSQTGVASENAGVGTGTLTITVGTDAFDVEIDAALKARGIDLICLAGFMRILGDAFVRRYEGRMMNIHPSLLPAFPGLHTHRRALEA